MALGSSMIVSSANTLDDFYKDKMIDLAVSTSSGDDFNASARGIARRVVRYIPEARLIFVVQSASNST